jgi:predicted nucleic-acid-binding protein
VIAVDTNVLVRFLVEDDPEQTRKAKTLLQRAVEAGEEIYVPDIVLCEVVWVLGSSYRIARAEIASQLGALLRARHLRFAASDQLARALTAFRRGKGDFADYLIREQSTAAGCEAVATYDRLLLKEDGFRAV